MALAIETILARSHLFGSLSARQLRQIAGLATRRSLGAGALVFSQGDRGDALYGVVTGRVRISALGGDGREVFLNDLEPGDTFGEIALLDGAARTATATAIVPSELVLIGREGFLRLLRGEPELSFHLLELLCRRIRWTSGLAEDSVLLDSPARLARRLLALAHRHGAAAAGAVQVRLSQQEIARFLGLSRQIVNQYLQQWKTRGWVTLGRGRITLLDGSALQRVAAGGSSPRGDGRG